MKPADLGEANVNTGKAACAAKIRMAGVVPESVTDGPGVRLVVFLQGCPHHCPGCHNPETHDPSGGRDMAVQEILSLYDDDPLLSGVTFSGGEPFLQPEPLADIADYIHSAGGDVICYTGFTLDKLQVIARENASVDALMGKIDLLIDGPFLIGERSLDIPFRGSRNQRVIAMNEGKGKRLADEIKRVENRGTF